MVGRVGQEPLLPLLGTFENWPLLPHRHRMPPGTVVIGWLRAALAGRNELQRPVASCAAQFGAQQERRPATVQAQHQ